MTETEARVILTEHLTAARLDDSGWEARQVDGLGWYFIRPATRSSTCIAISAAGRVVPFPATQYRPRDVLADMDAGKI